MNRSEKGAQRRTIYPRLQRMNASRALRYHAFGPPDEQLVLEKIPLPALKPGQALIRMLAAPINPSDIGMILGRYGKLKTLPAVAGREGVGEVLAVGAGVETLKTGQRVRFPAETGTWQEACIAESKKLFPIPEGVPTEMAAMAFINPPTAWLLLNKFASLKPGDWIAQNAANSAVGLLVIQIARELGFHTLNVVRRRELALKLKAWGADVVVIESDNYDEKLESFTDGAAIRLALNSVGSQSAIKLIKCLSPGGVHVTFGGMAFEPIRFPTRQLIFDDIQLRGFWLEKWRQAQSKEIRASLYENLFTLMREGALHVPVEGRYRLSQYREALAHAARPRFGKVLFAGENSQE